MEKIRSGQSFLYRDGGLNSTIIDTRLKTKVNEGVLNRALIEAVKRFPYFASKLVERNGDYYIADNRDISMIAKRKAFHALGSMSAGYHLIEVTYYGEHVYVSFHHALCDGRGVKPFVETLIYYYFCILKNKTFAADNVRKVDTPMFDDVTAEPFAERYAVEPYTPPNVVKDGFAPPEYAEQSIENTRYEIEIDAEPFMAFARANNATPSVLMAYLYSKSILLNNAQVDKPIVTSLAADMRSELGLPNTHKNCVRSIYLPFYEEQADAPMGEVCTAMRREMDAQREPNYVRETANSFIGLSDKLDTMNGLDEKRKFMSFFDTMTIKSYVLSYLGAFDFGECGAFVDAVHFFGSGIRGTTVNLSCFGGKFSVDVIQNVDGEKYVKTLMALLDEYNLPYNYVGKFDFTTVKETAHKTATRQAERWRIPKQAKIAYLQNGGGGV